MTAYNDMHALAEDPAFRQRIEMAAVKFGQLNVPQEAPTTANHRRRLAWSYEVLHDPADAGALMAKGVAANGNTAADSDAQLEATVASLWDAYAGIEPATG